MSPPARWLRGWRSGIPPMARVLVVLVGVAAAAALVWAVARPDGITRDQAIEIAEGHAIGSLDDLTLVSAESGRLEEFQPGIGVHGERTVWEVVFEGEFPPVGCGPSRPPAQTPPAACTEPGRTMRVYIDRFSGEWLLASQP